jgi:hypothetical protein
MNIATDNLKNINPSEIARLAYFAWERDGRPHGRDQEYWLQAEKQIQATQQLLVSEKTQTFAAPAMTGAIKINTKPGLTRSRRNGAGKISVR